MLNIMKYFVSLMNMTISRLVSYAKSVLDDIVKKKEIEEADFEEMLNTENSKHGVKYRNA